MHLMPRNFLEIINNYAASNGKPTIEWGDICNSFPSLSTEVPQKGDMKVTTSVHCECTVASYLLENIPAQSIFEIGISKRSCWLCGRYLGFLAEPDGSTRAAKFVVSGFQGKIHAGWRPPASPVEVVGRMIGLIAHEMDEILGNIQQTNRSDSFPGSPDEETEGDKFLKNRMAKFLKDTFMGSVF
jgi:OTT_1508-like deaminase